jgi:pyrroline-5-carboxylate reductase
MPPIGGAILLIGGGKMGGALLQGWLKAGVPSEDIYVVEPGDEQRSALGRAGAGHVIASPDELPPGLTATTLVLAVKPQLMDDVAPLYRGQVSELTLVLSIAAGKTIAGFERVYGEDTAVVRAMPNTPASVGRGATVLCANANARAEQRTLAQQLMRAVGEVFWVEDEGLMHVVTALSGGGPAYVFLLIEALADAGAKLGLPDDLAMSLARTTVIGSGELARLSSEPAAQLRRNVTSPAGTTERALNVLMREDGLQALLDQAIAAATERSRELGR